MGVSECRFCGTKIDGAYAKASVVSQAALTQAIKSANINRSLRNLLYFFLGMAVVVYFLDPPFLGALIVLSILNLIGPLKWLRKYSASMSCNGEVLKAEKDMKIEIYLWTAAIILEGTLLAIWLFKR